MRTMLALLFCLFAALPAARAETGATLEIENAWARSTAPGLPTGAVYFTLRNRGAADDTLLSAATDICTKVQLHESLNQNGVMVMRPLEGVTVPAGGAVAFEAGGKHAMLIGLKAPLVAGATFPLTLTFEKAGVLETNVTVKGNGQSGMPMNGMDMNHMDMGGMNHPQ